MREDCQRITAPHNAHIPQHRSWRNPASQTAEPNTKTNMIPMYCTVHKLHEY